MDNDAEVLRAANDAVIEIDLRYRAASFDDKTVLKPERDRAFHQYQAARLKLLEEGVICTGDDVAEMREIREEVIKAAQTQALLNAIGRVVGFLARVAAV